jgi:hypothetical protein
MTRVSPVTNAGQTISRSQEQPDPDNRDAGNGCRLWRPMQNVSEVNLHSIPLDRTNRGMPELRKLPRNDHPRAIDDIGLLRNRRS